MRQPLTMLHNGRHGTLSRSLTIFALRGVALFLVVGAWLPMWPNSAVAQTSPLTVQPSTSRVGIGTTTPSEKLDVAGSVRASGYKAADGTAGSSTSTGGATFKNGLYTAGTINAPTAAPGSSQLVWGNAGTTTWRSTILIYQITSPGCNGTAANGVLSTSATCSTQPCQNSEGSWSYRYCGGTCGPYLPETCTNTPFGRIVGP
jgi:hypothetical protein